MSARSPTSTTRAPSTTSWPPERDKARAVARETLAAVYERVGFLPPRA